MYAMLSFMPVVTSNPPLPNFFRIRHLDPLAALGAPLSLAPRPPRIRRGLSARTNHLRCTTWLSQQPAFLPWLCARLPRANLLLSGAGPKLRAEPGIAF